MGEQMSYEAAFEELKAIESEIVNETATIDVLADKIKRAAELIKYCQAKLRTAEQQVNAVIADIETA
jgi:exodeoxyribonuclease VII small subunit